MRKRIAFAAVLALSLALLITGGTLAYFTDEAKTDNVITTGGIDIELKEMAIPEGGGDPVPFKDRENIMPGMEVSKIVSVVNKGESPAYIRVKVDKKIKLVNGSTENADPSLVYYDVNKKDWTEKDGYYYYNKVLEPKAETEALFTTVTFNIAMGNLYQGSKAYIDVNADAVQVANNGASALEAAGWPVAE